MDNVGLGELWWFVVEEDLTGVWGRDRFENGFRFETDEICRDLAHSR